MARRRGPQQPSRRRGRPIRRPLGSVVAAAPQSLDTLAPFLATVRPLGNSLQQWWQGVEALGGPARVGAATRLCSVLEGAAALATRDRGPGDALTHRFSAAAQALRGGNAAHAVAPVWRDMAGPLAEVGALLTLLNLPPAREVVGAPAQAPMDAAALRAQLERARGPGQVWRCIQVDELVQIWLSCLPPAGTWVDLGTGAGHSLAGLARRAPGAHFVGVDLASARLGRLARLPAHARRLLLGAPDAPLPPGPADADTLAQVARGALGPRSADVLSLLYPVHQRDPSADQPDRLSVEVQLDTALSVLRPGGTGLLVTEDPAAWRRCAQRLAADPRVRCLELVPEAVSAAQLVELGVQPYQPTLGDLGPADPSVADRPAPRFGWGLVLIFVRAGGG